MPGQSEHRHHAAIILAAFLGFAPLPATAGWDAVVVAEAPEVDLPEDDDYAPIESALDSDPIEPVNRFFYQVNEGLRTLLVRPLVEVYDNFLPPPVRNRVSSLLDNLRTPVVLVNDLLQGEGNRAWTTTQRFAINTTYGVGGLWDRAAEMGIEGHEEDFGQTLAVWGVGEGFYMVLPLLGPSNPRDATGQILVDGFLDPLGLYLRNTHHHAESWSHTGTDGVDEYNGVKGELDHVREYSLDPYAGIRSMHRQKRLAEIRNDRDDELPPIPDLSKTPATSVSWTPSVHVPGEPARLAATWAPTVTTLPTATGWTVEVRTGWDVQVAAAAD